MKLGLEDKAIVVTGASRGIGRAIALGFASEGAHVAICARGEETLRGTEDELRRQAGKVFAQSCDVSDAAALDGFLEAAHAALGGVDVLVNNASGFGMGNDEAGWKLGLDIDLMASVRACWKVIPWLEESGGGSIIHISSTSSRSRNCRRSD